MIPTVLLNPGARVGHLREIRGECHPIRAAKGVRIHGLRTTGGRHAQVGGQPEPDGSGVIQNMDMRILCNTKHAYHVDHYIYIYT